MYGKIFQSMYEGSMYGDWKAIATLQQMIVLCNRFGVLDMTPEALAAKTSFPVALIKAGLEKLALPDPQSRSDKEEGRRIILLDPSRSWGWKIVNHAKYRQIASLEDRLEYNRKYMEGKRNKNIGVGNSSKQSAIVVNSSPSDAVSSKHIHTHKEKTFLSDSTEIGLARFLFELIQKRNPKHKSPNFQVWARNIDLMIRIDKRDPKEIRKVIEAAQADEFWKNNILSPDKLRKQYDQLILKL